MLFVSPAAHHLAAFLALAFVIIPSHGSSLDHESTMKTDLVRADLVDPNPFPPRAAYQAFPDNAVFGSPSNVVVDNNRMDESSATHTQGQNRRTLQGFDTNADEEDDVEPVGYVLVLQEDASPALIRIELEDLIAGFGEEDTKIMYEYKHVFKGFAISHVSNALLGKIGETLIASIEYFTPDEPLRLHAADAPEEADPTATDGPEIIDVMGPREIGIHDHPTNWGLDRMDRFDQKTSTHANAYPFDGKYHYAYDGSGVEVFLLDTGVRSTHLELIGSPGIPSRVICGFDAFAVNGTDTSCEDKVGHGTFMAGAIGGIYYGVAKDVIINSVKVFNDVGQGTVSSAIAGLDYVIGEKKLSPGVPFVANLSFGLRDENMAAFQDALDATLKAGVTIVTSSGNHGSTGGGAQSGNGCEVSPSNFPGVISVAASTYKDESAQYNDLGRCIDFFAPGDRVSGIWNRDDTDAVTISGSSIAAAHATGAAALILEAFPHFTPEHVRLALTDIAEEGSITGIPMYARTPNKLLNVGVLTFVPDWDGMESRTAV